MRMGLLSFALWLVLPLAADADGKIYPTAIQARVTIPDQRALIHFTNGTERLVIETRFTGAGTNFAWVVPLPSLPVIEQATTGLFPTLEYLFGPKILHDVAPYYLCVLALLGVGYLVLFARRTAHMIWPDVSIYLLMFIGIGAGPHSQGWGLEGYLAALFVVLLMMVIARAVRGSDVFDLLMLLLLLGWVALLCLPALSTAGSRGMNVAFEGGAVSVLERRLVGIFETTTIAVRDSRALESWLLKNGFAFSTNSRPVIENYVKDGWVFVTAKVRRDSPALETSTPHPLSFTFKTARPVYPMRLTGVDNGPVTVDLYVFGPARAQAPGFKVVRCTRPLYPEPPARGSWPWLWPVPSLDSPPILHPLLRRWVEGSPVATKLSATLGPAEMGQDVRLDWVPYSEQTNNQYSRKGAATVALYWGFGALAAGLLATFFLTRGDKINGPLFPEMCAWTLALGIAVGSLAYWALPKIEVRLVRRSTAQLASRLFEVSQWTWDESDTNCAAARIWAASFLSKPVRPKQGYWDNTVRPKEGYWDNTLLGGTIHEEDSPGNFIFRETGNGSEFIGYDAQGAEHVPHRR